MGVVRFDQHHPNFADCHFEGPANEEFRAQIFKGGVYVGTVRSADGGQAWDADWRTVGEFPSIALAAAAVIAEFENSST